MTTWSDLLAPGHSRAFFEQRPLPAFDPAATTFHTANAWWLAELSRLVYRHDEEEDAAPPEPRRSAILTGAGLRQLHFFLDRPTDTQAFLVRADGPAPWAALVFRGTEELRDFITDLKGALSLPRDRAAVHRGFEEALDSVWTEVQTALASVDVPLYFAGHSLGAALATLAAARHAPRALYTFGSPRVGNALFTPSLSAVPAFRVVYGADLVTDLPFEALGFVHAGQRHPLPRRLVAALLGSWLAWFGQARPRALADHAPINYVRRLAT